MLSDKYFNISIEWENNDFLIIVEHKITLEKISESAKESLVEKKKNQLKQKLISNWFNPEEIRIDIGRSNRGTFINISHIPSGESLTQDGMKGENIEKVKKRLLDKL